MRRLFPILALVAGLALVSDLVFRLFESSVSLTWLSVGSTLLVHGSVFVYLQASGRRVEAAAKVGGLPDWVRAQVEKNRQKGLVSEVGGVVMIAVGAWPGSPEWWHLGLFSACLAFQVGAFLGESVIISAQLRLAGDVEGWVRTPDRELVGTI